MRNKLLSVVLALTVCIGLSACGGDTVGSTGSSTGSTGSSGSTQLDQSSDKVKTFSDGTYLVGEDIESGLYRVTLTDTIMNMGYVERSKDLKMELDSIIANIALTGDGYVEILDTDVAVKLQGVELVKIDINTLQPNIQTELNDGIYLVGYDLAPGTYKVEVTDTATGMGYVQRSKSVAMGMDDIISNEIIQGPSYVEVAESDFAIELQGVKITKK